MSAPKVGDRVRVIAGQWRGWSGRVLGVWTSHLWLRLSDADGRRYFRAIPAAEVEKVPTTPDSTPQSDEQGVDVGLDPEATNGPQNGGKR